MPFNKSEENPSGREKLTKFRDKVINNRLVSMFSWDNPDSLSREVVVALTNVFIDCPRPGWERTSEQPGNQGTTYNSLVDETEKLSDDEMRILTKIALTQRTEYTITPESKITEQTHSDEIAELNLHSLVRLGYLVYYYSTDPHTGFYRITEKAEKLLDRYGKSKHV